MVQQRFAALALDPVANTPDEFRKGLEASIARFAEIVKQIGLEPQ